MSIFEDTGFDLLPKIPVPGNTPVTIQPIQTPPIVPPVDSPVAMGTPDPIPSKKAEADWVGFSLGFLFLERLVLLFTWQKRTAPEKKALKISVL